MEQGKLDENGPAEAGAFHCGERTTSLHLRHANKTMVREMSAKAAIRPKISGQKRTFFAHWKGFDEFCDTAALRAANFRQKMAKAAVHEFSAGPLPLIKEANLLLPVVAMLTLPLVRMPVAYILVRFAFPDSPCICALPLNLVSHPTVEHPIAACWM